MYVCGRNTGHCTRISPQLGLVSLSPLNLLIHACSLLYLMPIHHIYLCIASLGLLVHAVNFEMHRRGKLTCVHFHLLWTSSCGPCLCVKSNVAAIWTVIGQLLIT